MERLCTFEIDGCYKFVDIKNIYGVRSVCAERDEKDDQFYLVIEHESEPKIRIGPEKWSQCRQMVRYVIEKLNYCLNYERFKMVIHDLNTFSVRYEDLQHIETELSLLGFFVKLSCRPVEENSDFYTALVIRDGPYALPEDVNKKYDEFNEWLLATK